MTGKELIIYILSKNLENELVFQDGRFLDFMSIDEAALKFNVGLATISLWYEMNIISGVKIGNNLFINQIE